MSEISELLERIDFERRQCANEGHPTTHISGGKEMCRCGGK